MGYAHHDGFGLRLATRFFFKSHPSRLGASVRANPFSPLRAQITIPILESSPNPYDPKSANRTTSIKVVTG